MNPKRPEEKKTTHAPAWLTATRQSLIAEFRQALAELEKPHARSDGEVSFEILDTEYNFTFDPDGNQVF